MRKSIIFLSLFTLNFVFSQDLPSSLTLQEAIDYAKINNRAAINASRDVDIANQQKREILATGLPQIEGSVDYQNFLKQPIQLVPAEFFGGQEGEFSKVIFGTEQSVNAFVRLNQKLFDGPYIVALQSAKVFLNISENLKVKSDLEIRKSVIDAYGNVLLVEESLLILERNVKVLEKNLYETTRIFENGLGEEESVEQLQITLSGVQSDFDSTLRFKKVAYKLLNITLGIDVFHDLKLTDNLETLAAEDRALLLIDTSFESSNNIDYKIAENDTEAKELQVKFQKSNALPSLSAFINGGYAAFNNEFTFLDSNQRWFGSSLIGVSLTIPIFSSGERSAATQQAKIDLEKAKTNLEETEQRLKLELESAKNDYLFSIEDYQNKKQNLSLAQRIEQKNQTKFFQGIGSSFELRQAQTQLYNAQREFLQSMVDVINSKATLETILNTSITN